MNTSSILTLALFLTVLGTSCTGGLSVSNENPSQLEAPDAETSPADEVADSTETETTVQNKVDVLESSQLELVTTNYNDNWSDVSWKSTTANSIEIKNTAEVEVSLSVSFENNNGFTFTGGTYPGDTGTCGSKLIADGSCTISISYEATKSGSEENTIEIAFSYQGEEVIREIPLAAESEASVLYEGFANSGIFTHSVSSTRIEYKGATLDAAGNIIATGFVGNSPNFDFVMVAIDGTGNFVPGFGSSGVSIDDVGANDKAFDVELMSDGNFGLGSYRGGSNWKFLAAAYSSAGAIYASSSTVLVSNRRNFAVGVDQSNNLILGGRNETGTKQMYIRKTSASAVVDTSFGVSGVVANPIGSAAASTVWAIEVDKSIANGDIYAVGFVDDGGAEDENYAVVRLNSDGSVDSGFNISGHFNYDHNDGKDIAYDAHLLTNGQILVAGVMTGSDEDMALMKLNSDGSLDSSFGVSGVAVSGLSGNDLAQSLAVQADGKILIAGYAPYLATRRCTVMRFLPDGTPDPSFGDSGVFQIDFSTDTAGNAICNEVMVREDGLIVVVGSGTLDGESVQSALAAAIVP